MDAVKPHDLLDFRLISLGSHRWLDALRGEGWMYQGYPRDHHVLVVAVGPDVNGEWAAYLQRAEQMPGFQVVMDEGAKIPEKVARDLFPGIRRPWRD